MGEIWNIESKDRVFRDRLWRVCQNSLIIRPAIEIFVDIRIIEWFDFGGYSAFNECLGAHLCETLWVGFCWRVRGLVNGGYREWRA